MGYLCQPAPTVRHNRTMAVNERFAMLAAPVLKMINARAYLASLLAICYLAYCYVNWYSVSAYTRSTQPPLHTCFLRLRKNATVQRAHICSTPSLFTGTDFLQILTNYTGRISLSQPIPPISIGHSISPWTQNHDPIQSNLEWTLVKAVSKPLQYIDQ